MSATEGTETVGITSLGTAGRGGFASAWRGFDIRAWFDRQMAIEADARSGFYLLPLGMMLGIALVYGLAWRPSLGLSLPVAAAFGIAAWRGWRGAALAAFAACVALGAASATFELRRVDTVIFSGEATVRIEGRVVWRDRDERNRMRYLVAIERTERPTLSRPPRRAAILVTSKHAPIPVGGTYRGLVRLRAPSGPALPGGYDFAFGAFFDGLGAYGFALGPPAPADESEPSTLSLGERFVTMRLAISDRIRSVIGGSEGAVAAAIIAGERSGIPADVERWLRVTGLSHVLSISGLHMALVAGFAMVLVRCLCAAFPAVALNVPAKKIAAVAALAVSAFYLALAGLDVATTRSFLMIAIMLTAVISDRAALTLRNVALSATVIFLTTPHALLTASFQMSFGATASIVGIYGALVRWHRGRSGERSQGRVVQAALAILGIAATSTVAGLATAPYAAFHFQRMAPFGLVANMLALPIFSFWIMPLALVGMVAMPFGLDAVPLRLLGKGLTLVFEIAHRLAEHLPDNATGLVTTAGLVVLTLALLASCFLASRLRLAAIPVAAVGLFLAPDRSPLPDLLVFEDGREVALLDSNGRLSPLKDRPNAFVQAQWERAYPASSQVRMEEASDAAAHFSCETIEDAAPRPETVPTAEASAPKNGRGKLPPRRYCRAATRTGLRVVWTDDYRRLGQACDESDIAIVARAVRLTACRSSARLVTLRTLRETGSLAISRSSETNAIAIIPSIRSSENEEWNAQRLAAWPEAWRRSEDERAPSEAP